MEQEAFILWVSLLCATPPLSAKAVVVKVGASASDAVAAITTAAITSVFVFINPPYTN
jgi:hypothetical protein